MSDQIAHALAGAAGGIVSMSLTYPLITVSTRAQVNNQQSKQNAFQAQLEALLKIVKDDGITGLYAGLNSALFGIAITQGTYYYWYEFVKSFFAGNKNGSVTTAESMLAGAIAGAFTCVFTNPIWVINTRLIVKKSALDDVSPKSTGVFSAMSQIMKEEGIQGFWKGVMPALVLVINPIIQYTAFEKLKESREKVKQLTTIDFFILGALSKLLATSITYPYIVIKSRMQLKQGTTEATRYNSVLDGFKKILATEGVKGLYKGIESKLIQSVLTSAFLFAFKEEFFAFAVKLLVGMNMRNGPLAAAKV